MANICWTSVDVKAAPACIKKIAAHLKQQDKLRHEVSAEYKKHTKSSYKKAEKMADECFAGDCPMEFEFSIESPELLRMSFNTKWSPPESFAKQLTEGFPKASIKGVFTESGNGVFGEFFGEEGNYSLNDLEEEEYLIKYDENYQELANWVKTCSITELKKEISKGGEGVDSEHWTSEGIQEIAARRIPWKDIPKYLGYFKEYGLASKALRDRLRNGDKKPTKRKDTK